MFVIGVFLLTACSDDLDEPTLEISQNNFNVSNNGETCTISIKTNTDWKAISQVSWISFDKTSGKGDSELQLIVNSNSSNKRSGKVIVYAETEFAEINVSQAASTTGKLSVSTGSCTITRTKSGSQYKYTIKAQYTISGGHLASEAGIMFGNTKSSTTGTISDGVHTATAYVTTSSSTYTVSYKAYAKQKSNGSTIYGTTKTKKY